MNQPQPQNRTEHLYKRLIEHMNEAVWMGDSEERTVYANPKFCEMMGYTLEEMMGKESYLFWDEASAETVRRVNEGDRRKGVASSYEGNLLTKSGKKIPVLLSGTPLADGGTIGIMTDLTSLKEKERKEHLLSSAIQFATDAIIMFDTEGHITSWNKGAKILLGYKNEEIIEAPIDQVYKRDDINQVLEDGEMIFNAEIKARHKNGSPVDTSVTLTRVMNEEENTIECYLLIARDITMQHKFEEELAQRYERMQMIYKEYGIVKRQMDYIFEALQYFRKAPDLKSAADYFVSSMIMLSHVDACVLRRINPERGTLDLLSCFGVNEAWHGKASLKVENSLAEKAFKKGGTIKVIDLMREPLYRSKSMAKNNNLASLLLIPLISKGELVGTLSLYSSPQKKLELLDDEFIMKYASIIELGMGTLLN